jgi:uncharacterized protein (TIGR02246 family)
MLKQSLITAALVVAFAAVAAAQNTNTGTTAPPAAPRRPTSTTRQQTTTTTTTTTTTPAQTTPPIVTVEPAQPTRARRPTSPARAAQTAAEQEVRATFDALLRAVEKRDVEAVMNFYWNSPQLLIYNNNGTVTRGWTQVRANLASLYPELQDVKIEARDVRAQLLGTDAAVLTAAWTQAQTYKGTPETSSGRMTVLLRKVGGAWKIAHRHTSPDAPDASRLPASEQAAPTPTPAPGVRPPEL